MITARDLDFAVQAGTLRVGLQRNAVAVKCALCHTDCLPGQAVKVYLSARGWRYVYLCRAACAPKPEGGKL